MIFYITLLILLNYYWHILDYFVWRTPYIFFGSSDFICDQLKILEKLVVLNSLAEVTSELSKKSLYYFWWNYVNIRFLVKLFFSQIFFSQISFVSFSVTGRTAESHKFVRWVNLYHMKLNIFVQTKFNIKLHLVKIVDIWK